MKKAILINCLYFGTVAFMALALPATVVAVKPKPAEAAAEAQEDAKAEEKPQEQPRSALDQHRDLLERMHQEEMKRLEAAKTIAEERDREDMKTEAEERIKEAQARHQAALKRLEAHAAAGGDDA
jgi:hypothetical protein